jgi:hypothetical protein
MDSDEYHKIVEYENELYDLNHGRDQESDRDNSAEIPTEQPESDNDNSEHSAAPSNPKNAMAETNSVASNNPTEERDYYFSDSANLSEDERDMIYAQLYHSASTLSSKNNIPAEEVMPSAISSTQSGVFNTEYTVPSINFTFELDADNLQPSVEPANPPIETISFDEDDFGVYILLRTYIDLYSLQDEVVISDLQNRIVPPQRQ